MSFLRGVSKGAALLLGLGLLAMTAPSARAADGGVIKGRVINGNTGEPQSGARVTLIGANEDGSDRIRRTLTTDRSGRYRFGGLDTAEERAYAIDAIFDGGFFAGRPVRFPEDAVPNPIIESTLRVWNTTTDPAAVLITRDDMFAVLGSDGIAMIESATVVNQTNDAYIGRGADMGSKETAPSVGFSLPIDCRQAGVTIVDADIDIPQIVCTDFGFGITTAIPPGEFRTTFSYRVPGTTNTFDLTRTALYDISSLSVFAADPLKIESNRLVEKGTVTLAGKEYRRWSSSAPAGPGDSIQIVAIAEAGLTPGLMIGMGAAILLFGGIGFLSFRRARRGRPDEEQQTPDAGSSVEAIARLDLAYRDGDLSREEWTAERERLKSALDGTEKS
jgi:hypothetical protein